MHLVKNAMKKGRQYTRVLVVFACLLSSEDNINVYDDKVKDATN